ncbi:hypothetical protein HYFRA_00013896 [Hymenoscyphus fraxineus]|uniref:Uncharacterized protein n=1 Tax=Hymenoscyphus fraxineus TaxID=746836 RepID=A0A9N9PVK0_9HELO|nr:hypothetical protein HYFRA_00013896 [Hymenoscyphus fraxineus]
MRITTFSILAIATLSTGVAAGKHFAYCLDKADRYYSFNSYASTRSCDRYAARTGGTCADCVWRDDASKTGDEKCYSEGGHIEENAIDNLCKHFGADKAFTA